jgi:hypothetical protein
MTPAPSTAALRTMNERVDGIALSSRCALASRLILARVLQAKDAKKPGTSPAFS